MIANAMTRIARASSAPGRSLAATLSDCTHAPVGGFGQGRRRPTIRIPVSCSQADRSIAPLPFELTGPTAPTSPSRSPDGHSHRRHRRRRNHYSRTSAGDEQRPAQLRAADAVISLPHPRLDPMLNAVIRVSPTVSSWTLSSPLTRSILGLRPASRVRASRRLGEKAIAPTRTTTTLMLSAEHRTSRDRP
jgi:hypothetical protein